MLNLHKHPLKIVEKFPADKKDMIDSWVK